MTPENQEIPGKSSNTEELVMQFDPNTIEHLGIQMYSTLPPVISELVSNSYDADAKSVSIFLNDIDEKKIIISDSGHGMTFEDINLKFLKIGRNRRETEQNQKSESGNRFVIGKKGIGKLSFFGIASTILMETIRGGKKNAFKLDWEKLTKSGANYKPEIVYKNIETSETPGTKITLTNLKRKSPFDPENISYNLAKTFSIFNEKDFNVKIIHNDELSTEIIVKNEMRFQNIETEFEWDFPINIEGINYEYEHQITGKVISGKETVPAAMKGITLFSRGKLVNEPEFYEEKATSFGYSYLTGWLNVDFIDNWKKDVISTNRKSLNWEDDDTARLRIYLAEVVKYIYNDQRKKKKEKQKKLIVQITKVDVDKWIMELPKHEKKLANKIVDSILNAEGLPTEKQGELVKYVKDSFQYESFKELASEIGDNQVNPEKFVEFFKEWKAIEARELYKLSIVRIKTIKSFEKLIKENAKEVPVMHDFLVKFSWLLDPRLLNFKDEVTYSKLLKENFKDDSELGSDKRIDFLCHQFGNSFFIIELKRPEKVIGSKELDQSLEYVAFIRSRLSNEYDQSVYCYIIGKKLSDNPAVKIKADSYMKSNTVYFKPYEALLAAAINYHQEFIDRYEEMEKREMT